MKILFQLLLLAVSITIIYDEDGRPDYKKINQQFMSINE
jgi:hypothetical protein